MGENKLHYQLCEHGAKIIERDLAFDSKTYYDYLGETMRDDLEEMYRQADTFSYTLTINGSNITKNFNDLHDLQYDEIGEELRDDYEHLISSS
jgi:hypothetical protein